MVNSPLKVIHFFLANGLIPKTKANKYKNISFKFDEQTLNKEHSKNFKHRFELKDFIDLETGKDLSTFQTFEDKLKQSKISRIK